MIRQQDLRSLSYDRPGPCISLFMPLEDATHHAAVPIRFRNMIRMIESELVTAGTASSHAEQLLRVAQNFSDDNAFWKRQNGSLACFVAPEFFSVKQVPLQLQTEFHILDRFVIRPLLPLLCPHRRFFVLALNQDRARLYEATLQSILKIPLLSISETTNKGVSKRRDLSTWRDDLAGISGQWRIETSPSLHRHPHQHEKQILHFFREVDRVVNEILKEVNCPLVLASVGFLADLYRSINSHRSTVPAKIPGNPENWSELELHVKAREIVHPHVQKGRRQARREFEVATSTPNSSRNVEEIVTAADDGRVDTLIISAHSDCSGSNDAQQQIVKPHGRGDRDDLIDFAATKTLRYGGSVLVADEMPQNTPLAATLRNAVTRN